MTPIYLAEASLPDLLAEISKRFEARNPLPEWGAVIVFSVAAFYGISPEQLRCHSREEHLVKCRHLTIALLAQLNPSRTRAEVCAVLGRGHEMYAHALAKTDHRSKCFPEFRAEIREILKIISETNAGHAHCRTSPQGTRAPQG